MPSSFCIWSHFPCPDRVRDFSGKYASPGMLGDPTRALPLVADRKIELAHIPAPPPPQAGEVQVRVRAVGLNHLDLWGFRGMAFAKRKLPLVVGAEAAGEIAAV